MVGNAQPIFKNGADTISQDKDSSGGGVSDLHVVLSQAPGRLSFDYNITADLSITNSAIASALRGKGPNSTTAHLIVNPSRISNIQNDIQNKLVSKLSDATGIPSQFFNGYVSSGLPSSSKFDQSIPLSLKATLREPLIGTVIQAGHSPVKGSKTITFPTIKIPVPSSIDLENLIPRSDRPELTFSIKTTNIFNKNPGAQVSFTLDPGLFIEKVNIGQIPCDQIFKTIGNKLSNVESNSKSLKSNVDSYANRIENIKNKVLSHSTESRLSNVSPSNISGIGSDELRTFRSDLNGFSNYKNKLNNIKSSFNTVKNDVDNIKYGRCRNNMGIGIDTVNSDINHITNKLNSIQQDVNRLKDVLSNVSGLSCGNRYGSIQSDINNIKSNLNISSSGTIPSGINISKLESEANNIKNVENKVNNNLNSESSCYNLFMSQISSIKSSIQSAISNTQGGCGQISKSILNQITQFNVSANQFASLSIQRRTSSKYHSLINNGENLIGTINNNVSNSNPCKQKKLSQVHNALSKIKNSGPRSKQSLPCSDQYNNISKEINSFENMINSASAPISSKELTNLANQGNKIRHDIEHNIPTGDPCRQSMVKKVSVLINHANNLRPHVRISTQEPGKQKSSREQQILKQLQSSLNQLTGSRGK